MSFIESKGYIHANLRASSVLLFADDSVKISGFSVSRPSHDAEACKISDGQSLQLAYYRALVSPYNYCLQCIVVVQRGF